MILSYSIIITSYSTLIQAVRREAGVRLPTPINFCHSFLSSAVLLSATYFPFIRLLSRYILFLRRVALSIILPSIMSCGNDLWLLLLLLLLLPMPLPLPLPHCHYHYHYHYYFSGLLLTGLVFQLLQAGWDTKSKPLGFVNFFYHLTKVSIKVYISLLSLIFNYGMASSRIMYCGNSTQYSHLVNSWEFEPTSLCTVARHNYQMAVPRF